jgi:hypothetical protein
MGWGTHYIEREALSEIRNNIIESKRSMNSSNIFSVANTTFNDYIKPVLDAYQFVFSALAENRGGLIYRARKCDSGQAWGKITDLLGPSSPSGRAVTGTNMPILYAASSIQTALAEINTKPGDVVNILQLKYSSSGLGKFWFVGQLAEHYRSNEVSRYVAEPDNMLMPLYVEPHIRTLLAFKDRLMNEIFSDLSSEKDEYVLNRLMISHIMDMPVIRDNFSGVVYRSNQDPPGMNFAIAGAAIDRLDPQIVNLLKVEYVDEYGAFSYKILGNSRSREGMLTWSHVTRANS